MADDLHTELEAIASLLDAQTRPVRETFQYCLRLMMIEAGKMSLEETVPGDATPICVFETFAGETFSVPRPPFARFAMRTILGEGFLPNARK
jgi:hypothetical protein